MQRQPGDGEHGARATLRTPTAAARRAGRARVDAGIVLLLLMGLLLALQFVWFVGDPAADAVSDADTAAETEEVTTDG